MQFSSFRQAWCYVAAVGAVVLLTGPGCGADESNPLPPAVEVAATQPYLKAHEPTKTQVTVTVRAPQAAESSNRFFIRWRNLQGSVTPPLPFLPLPYSFGRQET